MPPSTTSSTSHSPQSSQIPPKDRPDPIPKSKPSTSTSDPFASLPPAFDAERFQPPVWAKDLAHLPSRSSGADGDDQGAGSSSGPGTRTGEDGEGEGDDTESLGLSEQDTLWEDAREEFDEVVDEKTGEFTLSELKRLFDKATGLKTEGNVHFTGRPPRYDEAIQAYQAALGCLPDRQPPTKEKEGASHMTGVNGSEGTSTKPPIPSTGAGAPSHPPIPAGTSGIQELTEAEAAALEAELMRSQDQSDVLADSAESEREKTEDELKEEMYEAIRELRKVCYGNMGAVWLAQTGKEKECVDVCSEALKIDPTYIKGLQRRATANDRLNTWSSLTAAQEDYTSLLTLLPQSALPPIRRCLATLPARISAQQEKEKDEMMSKLKDLGNGLLGKFGLSTDMFKFDQQEGGGYSMRFER